MIDKRELLLEHIIEEYIKKPEPIGSEYLRVRLNIKISSATIRNYFKVLGEEGKLEQMHISSGRVPTNSALRLYWKQHIDPNESIDLDSNALEKIKQGAEETNTFCIVRFYEPNFLKEVINSDERFLIAVFERGEIVISYSAPLERFLNELKGLEINDLVKISDEVGAHSLSKKLKSLTDDEPHFKEGDRELIDMVVSAEPIIDSVDAYLSGDIMDRILNGIYFKEIVPEGFMAIKQDITIMDKNAKMMVVGKLFRDYNRFYSLIKKED